MEDTLQFIHLGEIIRKYPFPSEATEISNLLIDLGPTLREDGYVLCVKGQYYNYWSLPEMISDINKVHKLDLEKVFNHFRDDMIRITERRNQETLEFLKHITVLNNEQ